MDGNRFGMLYGKISDAANRAYPKIGKAFVLLAMAAILLEAAAFVASVAVWKASGGNYSDRLSEYNQQPWMPEYRAAESRLEVGFHPYVEYLFKPIASDNLNIDENSVRRTDNPCASQNSAKIFLFGGSTMFGSGSRDNYTIASYLSRELCARGISANVTNFGVGGYVMQQGVLRLMLELERGDVPDYAIFYDGVNDAHYAYVNGRVGAMPNLNARSVEFNMRKGFSAVPFFYQDNIGRGITYLATRKATAPQFKGFLDSIGYPDESGYRMQYSDQEVQALGGQVASQYFAQVRVADALAKDYNFTSAYFLQPNLFTKKHLSGYENGTAAGFVGIDRIYRAAYSGIAASGEADRGGFHDISTVFDNESGTVYIDNCHLLEDGNKRVADAITQGVWGNAAQSAGRDT